MIETEMLEGAAGPLELRRLRPAGAPRGAVLLTHGAWHGAWCWEPFAMPALAARGYECGALSLRGHGRSGGRVRWASIAGYVDDVRRAAAAMGDPALIGHSMGGFVVQHYAQRHPVQAYALLAPAPPTGPWPLVRRMALSRPGALFATLFTLDLLAVVADRDAARRLLYSRGEDREEMDPHLDRLQSESFRAFFDMLLRRVRRPAPAGVPRAVFGAEEDAVFPPREVGRVAGFHNVAPRMLPDASHMAMLDESHAATAAALADWLDEVFPL